MPAVPAGVQVPRAVGALRLAGYRSEVGVGQRVAHDQQDGISSPSSCASRQARLDLREDLARAREQTAPLVARGIFENLFEQGIENPADGRTFPDAERLLQGFAVDIEVADREGGVLLNDPNDASAQLGQLRARRETSQAVAQCVGPTRREQIVQVSVPTVRTNRRTALSVIPCL